MPPRCKSAAIGTPTSVHERRSARSTPRPRKVNAVAYDLSANGKYHQYDDDAENYMRENITARSGASSHASSARLGFVTEPRHLRVCSERALRAGSLRRRVFAGADQRFFATIQSAVGSEDDHVRFAPTASCPLAAPLPRISADLMIFASACPSDIPFSLAHFSVSGNNVSSALAPVRLHQKANACRPHQSERGRADDVDVPSAKPATIASGRGTAQRRIEAKIGIEIANVDVDK